MERIAATFRNNVTATYNVFSAALAVDEDYPPRPESTYSLPSVTRAGVRDRAGT